MAEILEPPCLLVALPQLQDPNFHRSVLLLIEYNEDGAVGFVVNRPSRLPLKEIVDLNGLEIPDCLPAWIGGPVGAESGLVLHNQKETDPEAAVRTGVYLSTSDTAIDGLVAFAEASEKAGRAGASSGLSPAKPARLAPYSCLYPYRFVVGYAGWGPGQLDDELRLGAWLQMPYNETLLFNTPWQAMWETALENLGANPMDFAPVVQPYLN